LPQVTAVTKQVPHRTCPLVPLGEQYDPPSVIVMDCLHPVKLEVFTAVTMKKSVFWDVMPRGACKNRRFGGTYRLLYQGDKNR
jgi:hypothetical protein